MLIESKVLGQRKRPFEPWELNLFESKVETLSLEKFLSHVVLQEIEAFKIRQEERKLLQVLSKEEMAAGTLKGKIDMGGRDLEQEIQPQEAIENALLAFKDGFYYVFVDQKQIEKLEEEITLYPNSHIMFLRLVPLVGG